MVFTDMNCNWAATFLKNSGLKHPFSCQTLSVTVELLHRKRYVFLNYLETLKSFKNSLHIFCNHFFRIIFPCYSMKKPRLTNYQTFPCTDFGCWINESSGHRTYQMRGIVSIIRNPENKHQYNPVKLCSINFVFWDSDSRNGTIFTCVGIEILNT